MSGAVDRLRARRVQRTYEVLGDDTAPMHVQARNVPAYPVNLMSSDAPPSDLGDPAATLQMGDLVDAVGPSVNNPKGAPFTPVKIRGRDGVYWVRSTSVAENAPLQVAARAALPSSASRPERGGRGVAGKDMPWWGWLGIGLGGVAVVGGGMYLLRKKR